MEIISTTSLEKVFYVEIFLNQFNVSTHTLAQIKRMIIEMFNELKIYGLIRNQYKLVKKSGQIEQVDKLTSLLLGQTSRMYLYENLV